MGESTNNTKSTTEYLAQLLKDKKQISAFPNTFVHLERLLDEEISKVRATLLNANNHANFEPLILPEPKGPKITLSEKIYVPTKDYPDFNFIGRILGPRGMTSKQLEQETGCKIMIRGKGSMRDKKKEDMNKGKPNWEHLNDELHVLVTIEDTEERAEIRMQRARDEIERLLVPAADGEDELKKMQLMELAILNGTFREPNGKASGNNGMGGNCGLQGYMGGPASTLALATFSAFNGNQLLAAAAANQGGTNGGRFLTASPGPTFATPSFVQGPGGTLIQLKAGPPQGFGASPLVYLTTAGGGGSPRSNGNSGTAPPSSSGGSGGASPYPPHAHHHLIDAGNGLIYAAATPTPGAFDLPYLIGGTPTFFEYPGPYEGAPPTIGAISKPRKLVLSRDHPYKMG